MNAKAETHVPNTFEALAAVDCSAYTEKKGKFTYLSWTFAVSELLKRHPGASWRTIETSEGWPYWKTEAGCFVKVGVTVDGIERVQIHPVLDGSNRTVAKPNAFQVNTSIQRALVKAIALHGLGLYIYAGEDLPEAVKDERAAASGAPDGARSVGPGQPLDGVWDGIDDARREELEGAAAIVGEYMETGDVTGAHEYLESMNFTTEEKAALWSILPSKTRTALKKLKQESAT